MLAKQNDKGSLQKTHRRSSTSSRKVWWLDYSRSQCPQRRMWASEQSLICNRGAGLGHPMDPVVSVQYKNFSGDGKEFKKVSRAVGEAGSHLHWQFIGIWQILWRSIMESSNFNTSSPRDEWCCWKSGAQSTRGTSAVLLQSGLDGQWWADSMECFCYLRNVQDLLEDGKTLYELRFGEPFKVPIIPFGAMVGNHPISAREINQEFINLARRYYLVSFLAMRQSRREFGKDIFWLRIWKIWKSWTHKKIILEESTRTKYWYHKKGEEFIFPVAGGTANCQEETTNSENPLQGVNNLWGVKISEENFKANWKGFQPTETKDDAEARRDIWSIQGDVMYRHHNEPRVQLYVPKRRNIPYSIEIHWCNKVYSHWSGRHARKRVDDKRNVDLDRSLSDSWKEFTKFTLLKEKTPKGYMWSGERLTKIQATTRPENLWPEVWSKMGKAAQKKEKQEWANEKPKFDNARKTESHISSIWKMVNLKKPSKNAKEKVGSSNGGGNAFQKRNKAEALQASGNWCEERWIQQYSRHKACVRCGSSRINKKAFGIISTEKIMKVTSQAKVRKIDESLWFGT